MTATSARLHALVNPHGASTSYRFEYLPAAQYEGNIASGVDGFSGAAAAPSALGAPAGSGENPIPVVQGLFGLPAETAYRYRVVAENGFGSDRSDPLLFVTQGFVGRLPDGRGWEMVSPPAKNGGQVALPETLAGGGVIQAAPAGNAVTYSSATAFGSDAQGAPVASQYIAARTSSGWTTANITTPMLSGSYGTGPGGAPYELFSPDLGRGLLLNGRHCRDGGEGCPVANPPLPGSGAPAGYQNYYLRDNASSTYQALLGTGALAYTSLGPEHFDLVLAGSTPDLGYVVLSSCARLTPDATEIASADGCDPASQNLYLWNQGGLRLVNVLPDDDEGTPGARLAAQVGAIGTGGGRVYWQLGDDLYLREGDLTKQVDAAAGGGGTFETASADGSIAFFSKGGHLYRFEAATGTATDLAPAGGVEGVLGTSSDGKALYYLTGEGLFLRDGVVTSKVAADADPGNYPPATGTARVTGDGRRIAFVATAPLTGFDNRDQDTGQRDSQVYLYDAAADTLTCVSCNPTWGRPSGPSTTPGAYANGALPDSLRVYKPRALSVSGDRLFFESGDSLVPGDSNGRTDVYEWEETGAGDCARAGGCVSLISSGRAEAAILADSSASGDDVFFLTAASLVATDAGSVDLYDARVGGGFPSPPVPIACEGDACQSLPSPPPDQTVTTLVPGAGNPPLRYQKPRHGKKHGKRHRGGRHKHRSGKHKPRNGAPR